MPFLWSIALSVIPSLIGYSWLVRNFPAAAGRRRKVALALVALAVSRAVSRLAAIHTHAPVAAAVHLFLSTIAVTLAIASLPLGVLMGISWALERRGGRSSRGPLVIGRRQVFEAGAGTALFGATGSMLGWGMVRGRHEFQLTEVSVDIPGLPRALEGYVIAHVSDIHAGLLVDEGHLDAGLALVRRARPDLVAVTGDLVDDDVRFAPLVARKLLALRPRDGIVGCLGNHDYYAGAQRVERVMRDAGIHLLVDEGRVVRAADGGGFALLGVDDIASRWHGRKGPRLDQAMSTVPPDLPRVLLSHQPITVDRWAGRVALQLSGHTHGGQINPGSVLNPIFEYVAGAYRVRSTTLYVSRGFGTVGPPSRVGAPPEVTRIVLHGV